MLESEGHKGIMAASEELYRQKRQLWVDLVMEWVTIHRGAARRRVKKPTPEKTFFAGCDSLSSFSPRPLTSLWYMVPTFEHSAQST